MNSLIELFDRIKSIQEMSKEISLINILILMGFLMLVKYMDKLWITWMIISLDLDFLRMFNMTSRTFFSQKNLKFLIKESIVKIIITQRRIHYYVHPRFGIRTFVWFFQRGYLYFYQDYLLHIWWVPCRSVYSC